VKSEFGETRCEAAEPANRKLFGLKPDLDENKRKTDEALLTQSDVTTLVNNRFPRPTMILIEPCALGAERWMFFNAFNRTDPWRSFL
jgi:hypothetical protein